MSQTARDQRATSSKQPESVPETPWATAAEDLASELEADLERGLSADEAARRLERYGPNRLREIQQRSLWAIFIDQVKSPVVYLLFGAAAVAVAFQEWIDTAAIAVVLIINTVIGFATELRARRSMEALQAMGQSEATVLRDGEEQSIPSDELVPGDVLCLEEGDVVAADIRLFDIGTLQIDESALTGESVPVPKETEPCAADTLLADRVSMGYRGTATTRGTGRGLVVGTGMQTELGRVSDMVENAEVQETPMQRQLQELAQRLVWLTLVIVTAIAAVGLIGDRPLMEMIGMAIALAVAAIPEGLPVVATLALARGMHRMVQRNALVRKLGAVHDLGATTVICSDKTGTLTENRMRVRALALGEVGGASGEVHVHDYEGGDAAESDGQPSESDPAQRCAIAVCALCNTAKLKDGAEPGSEEDGKQRVLGDPMELALLTFARDSGGSLDKARPRLRLEAFERDTKMMATFHEGVEIAAGDDGDGDGVFVAVKGAPEAVLDACVDVLHGEERHQLDDSAREAWLQTNRDLAQRGLRVLALACKRAPERDVAPYEQLSLLGMVGLIDPPRSTVRDAVTRCRDAGIRVVMVTGDQPDTAAAIARDVKLTDSDAPKVVHGKNFGDAGQDVEHAEVLARVDPAQKLALVERLQAQGEIVAMTGDGVNDAPALKRADIGIAMGERGTEVAREAADVVLLDDAFETIVAAIRQGRIIFDNIRKFVVYLLSGNVGQLLAIGVCALAGAPLPLTALQILYLNMVNDVFPALAMGVSPGGDHVLERPPRNAKEPILARREWAEIMGYGVLIAATLLAVFFGAQHLLGTNVEQAMAIAFLTLSIGRLVHAWNMRDPRSGVLRNDILGNPWMWAAFGTCLALLALATYFGPLASVLALEPVTGRGWLLVLGGALVPAVFGQSYLLIRSARREPEPAQSA
ncbi:cation-translocating P-type ATPase [Haliangium ochraceum]|uniref:ATPase, P-type (Transporting), HAD superfamily, subfamily IC n=1 Tax=Haliangium ochraceum (strain DSM 14365 / JCM 11303 / SMP-2) TaxID=502025 RepID=D0LN98_HALO1|nr:cation-transporting P-type ATPase [Haliangium ochraceum]ACY15275.1 ATPase, P-type (transporting), HAD superfamily, subfamily IC [Haliangium ochraceum DSM 14365]